MLKEFLVKITEEIFSPDNQFFDETAVNRQVHPQFAAKDIDNYQHLFSFFGMIVGKAIYEGNLLNLNFTRFFLNSIVDKQN